MWLGKRFNYPAIRQRNCGVIVSWPATTQLTALKIWCQFGVKDR